MGRVYECKDKDGFLKATSLKEMNDNSTMEPFCLTFTYEKLLDFCFGCGLIGHSHKECSLWKERGP